jgi:uncharacterized protein (DUF2267 family)
MESQYERFITIVEHKGGISTREEAERAARATLQTLAERIAKGEALDLAEQLGPQLGPWLHTDRNDAERFGLEEFLRREAEREGTDLKTAERHARAVFSALGYTVSDDEIHDMVAELPGDFEPLIAEAERRASAILPVDDLILKAAERSGLEPDAARRAVNAVLETLAERISGGEVEDLIARLPIELRAPLRQGNATSKGNATRMSLDEFLERVAEREGVGVLDARRHARAMFETLREAVPEDEFLDATAELPNEYAAVGARP